MFLGYSMWKFRAKPGDRPDGQPVHGHTVLEIVWTMIPTIIVIGFAMRRESSSTATSGSRPTG